MLPVDFFNLNIYFMLCNVIIYYIFCISLILSVNIRYWSSNKKFFTISIDYQCIKLKNYVIFLKGIKFFLLFTKFFYNN